MPSLGSHTTGHTVHVPRRFLILLFFVYTAKHRSSCTIQVYQSSVSEKRRSYVMNTVPPCAPAFTLMPAASTSVPSVQVLDFRDSCLLIRHERLVCDSCSSGQRFAFSFLPTTPHGDAVAVRLALPPAGGARDFHPQASAPCRAHNKKDNPMDYS